MVHTEPDQTGTPLFKDAANGKSVNRTGFDGSSDLCTEIVGADKDEIAVQPGLAPSSGRPMPGRHLRPRQAGAG
jgi:hypothetical protein